MDHRTGHRHRHCLICTMCGTQTHIRENVPWGKALCQDAGRYCLSVTEILPCHHCAAQFPPIGQFPPGLEHEAVLKQRRAANLESEQAALEAEAGRRVSQAGQRAV